MAVETGLSVCKFFQTGYCKFKMTCIKKHVTTLCDDKMCNQKGCEKRHPRRCKYLIRYGNCKLGSICAYSHDNQNSKRENERLEKKMDELLDKTNKKDEIIKELLNDVKILIKKNEEKDLMIKNLVKEVKELKSPKINHTDQSEDEDSDEGKESEEEIIEDFVRYAKNSLKLLDAMEKDLKKSRKKDCMRIKFKTHNEKLWNEQLTCKNPAPPFLTFIHNCVLDNDFDRRNLYSEKDYKEKALKMIKEGRDLFEEFISNPVELSEDRP